MITLRYCIGLDKEIMAEKECLYYPQIEELEEKFYGGLLKSLDTFILESTDAAFQCFRRETERVIRHSQHVTASKARPSEVRIKFLGEIQDKYALWENSSMRICYGQKVKPSLLTVRNSSKLILTSTLN